MTADARLDLDAIQARADAATPGPWKHFHWPEGNEVHVTPKKPICAWPGFDGDAGKNARANAAFIAAARTDIPALLAECRRLRAALEEIAADSPPDDWKDWDGWNGYLGYGERGQPGFVDDVDESNMDDVHGHGISVGRWLAAKAARRALAAPPEGGQ